MRILFMGTPDFAAVSLRRLVEDGHEVCGVFTQPDKPRNRNKVTFSPVKEYALSQGIPVYQPLKLRDGTALSDVRALAPELIVVVAYGRILPDDILAVPPLGAINVHASLLPKYRGAAPINWAILNGETETGVSIMYLARELDAGDVICTASTPIGPEEDAPSLWDAAGGAGGPDSGPDAPRPGGRHRTPHAPGFQRQHLRAHALPGALRHRLEPGRRGYHQPGPGADPLALRLGGVGRPNAEDLPHPGGRSTHASPGTVLSAGRRGIEVACGDAQSLFLTELQAEGGRRMAASDYLLGHPMNCENT
jgi:methionyl-tRNA formyltransferase